MRIGHVISTIQRGGAENQLLILVREQIKHGLKVVVFPLKDNLDLLEDFENAGAEVDLRFHDKPFLVQVFLSFFGRFKDISVFHAHLPQSELLLSLSFRHTFITSRHFGGSFYPGRSQVVSTLLSRFVIWRSRHVIAISRFVLDYLQKSKEISRRKSCTVVPYGFEPSIFLTNTHFLESHTSSKSSRSSFGTLARLSPEKDLSTLIQGFELFVRQSRGVGSLDIFGEGPEHKKLLELVRTLNIEDKVHFHGKTNDAKSAFESFNTFVLASRFEGFGMVLLEAMSLNKVIISSDIQTSLEVLGQSDLIYFFKTGDVFDLALKMKESATSSLRKRHKFYQTRLRKFEAAVMEKKIFSIYQQVVD